MRTLLAALLFLPFACFATGANIGAISNTMDGSTTLAVANMHDASGTRLTATRISLYDKMIRNLKMNNDAWDSLIGLWVIAAATADQGFQNLRCTNLAGQSGCQSAATHSGGGTFAADLGWTFTGATTDYLDTGYDLSATSANTSAGTPAYGQNSAGMGVSTGTSVAETACREGGTNATLAPRSSTGKVLSRMNSITTDNSVSNTVKGIFAQNRSSSSSVDIFFNGTTSTVTNTSQAPTSGIHFFIGKCTATATTERVTAAWISAYQSSAKVGDIKTYVYDGFLNSIGAN